MNDFEKDAKELIFWYQLNMSRKKGWDDLIKILSTLYTKDHSFNFYINGDTTPIRYNHLDDWFTTVLPEMQSIYLEGQYVMGYIDCYPEDHSIDYTCYQMKDGKIASMDRVIAKLAYEDDTIKYKHADIYYNIL